MNNLLKNLLFVFTAITTLTIVSCSDDPGTEEPTIDYAGLSSLTGLSYDAADSYELTKSTKNGEQVIVLSGTIKEDVTIGAIAGYKWLFSGSVFVDGGTITIEEGITIYFDAESAQTSFLSILQGAKINAIGTSTAPITMTTSSELGTGTPTSGEWGGLVVNGKADINVGETAEGEGGTGLYGGSNDADNSGTIKYVVLKYPGRIVGVDNELNGFSFNGVGSATTIEYIQSFLGEDDGVEFFGGTANVKYAISTGSKDDSFDWTHGWRGKGQYWVVRQTAGRGDRAIEADNLEADFAAAPYSNPTLANLTLVNSDGNAGSTTGMRLRHGTKGKIHNAIVTGSYDAAIQADANSGSSPDPTTQANVDNGDLVVTNSTVFGLDAGATAWKEAASVWENANGNVSTTVTLSDAVIGTITGGTDANAIYSDAFFTADTNIGAVATGNNWLSGWALKADGSTY